MKKAQAVQAREARHIDALKAHSEQLQQLQADMESFEKDLNRLNGRLSETDDDIDKPEEELQESKGIMKHKDEIDALNESQKRLEERESNLKEERLNLLQDVWRDLLQPRLQARIEALAEIRDTLQEKIGQRAVLESQIQTLNKIFDAPKCPTCDQKISEKQREKMGKNLGKLEGQLKNLTSEKEKYSEVSSEINVLKKIHSSGGRPRVAQVERELDEIGVNMVDVESQRENLKEKVKGHDTAEIARKREKIVGFIKNKGGIERDISDVKDKIDENTRKQNQLSKLMSKNPKARITEGGLQVEIYSELAKIFEDGTDTLRDSLRSSVEGLAAKAFKHLTTEKTYQGLKINEHYGLSIVGHDKRVVEERSAGAEQIVALALIDGLNRTARKTGPIIMDTPLARLDPKHRSNVLKYLPEMAEQVILLVHEGEIRKEDVLKHLKDRIGVIYEIERISASESKIVSG